MDDRPWRKPGADITDYFNYGFTEETWNTYCERQKKLRAEFTSQAAVNKALFSNIYLANPLSMPGRLFFSILKTVRLQLWEIVKQLLEMKDLLR